MVTPYRINRRDLLRLSGTAASLALLSACVAEAPKGATASAEPGKAGRFALGKLEGPEIVTDASRFPKTFKEAPELAALVQQGKLPPVGERIGQDPLVIKPVHAIGKYGGTLRRSFTSGGAITPSEIRFASGPNFLVHRDYLGKTIVPNIARGYELSSDGKVITLQLRRGMRWSDGTPLTADDVMFWYEDIYLYKPLTPTASGNMRINGKDVTVKKIDTSTVQFVSPEANPLMLEIFAGTSPFDSSLYPGFAPKHYLSKFHPKYTPQAEVDKLAADAKFPSWPTLFKSRADWTANADLPVVTPWKVVKGKEISTQNLVLERNPYSIWVDTEGNQLPYIGTLSHSASENVEVMNLRAVAGEFDMQDRDILTNKLPVLVDNAQRSGYHIVLNPSGSVDFGLRVNLAYEDDPELGELIRTTDFRRALSLGIDRGQINEAFYLGTSTPTANVPADDNIYFPGKEYRTLWATYDVAKANQLLDGIGLTKKDADGYRLRKDGSRRIVLDYTVSQDDRAQIGEMIKQQWKNIGIDMTVNTITPTLITQRALANQLMFTGHTVSSEDVFLLPDTVFPYRTDQFTASLGVLYAKWFQSGGKEGKEPPLPKLKQVMDMWKQGYAAPEAERIRLGKEIHKICVDEVFNIGIVGMGLFQYGIFVVKDNLENVPARSILTIVLLTPLNTRPQSYFFK